MVRVYAEGYDYDKEEYTFVYSVDFTGDTAEWQESEAVRWICNHCGHESNVFAYRAVVSKPDGSATEVFKKLNRYYDF